MASTEFKAKASTKGRVAFFVPEHEIASLRYLNNLVPALSKIEGGLQPLVIPVRHDNEQRPDVRTAAHPILRKRSWLHRTTIGMIEEFQKAHVQNRGILEHFDQLSLPMLDRQHSRMALIEPITPNYDDPSAPFGRISLDIPVNGSGRSLKQVLTSYSVRMIVSARNYAYIGADVRRWARGEDPKTGEPTEVKDPNKRKLGGINLHPGPLMTSGGEAPGIKGLESPLATYALGFTELATTVHELRSGFDRGEIYGIVRTPMDEVDILFDYPAIASDKICAEVIREIENRRTGDRRPGRQQHDLDWENSTYDPDTAIDPTMGERFAGGNGYFTIPDYTENGPYTVGDENSLLELLDNALHARGKKIIDASDTIMRLTNDFGGPSKSALNGILNQAYYQDLLLSDPEIATLTAAHEPANDLRAAPPAPAVANGPPTPEYG